MSQAWPFDYYATLVSVTGPGDTLSEGVGSALDHGVWPFDYVSVIVAVTGPGDTLSEGVGSVKIGQAWDFDYWDGVNHGAGVGDTLSEGVGSASILGPATWYPITGTVIFTAVAAGAGDTLSGGVGDVVAIDGVVPVTGVGDTRSTGVGDVSSDIGFAMAIEVSEIWDDGVTVGAYPELAFPYECREPSGFPHEFVVVENHFALFRALEPQSTYYAFAGDRRLRFTTDPTDGLDGGDAFGPGDDFFDGGGAGDPGDGGVDGGGA